MILTGTANSPGCSKSPFFVPVAEKHANIGGTCAVACKPVGQSHSQTQHYLTRALSAGLWLAFPDQLYFSSLNQSKVSYYLHSGAFHSRGAHFGIITAPNSAAPQNHLSSFNSLPFTQKWGQSDSWGLLMWGCMMYLSLVRELCRWLKYFLLTVLFRSTMLCFPVDATRCSSTDGHLLQVIHWPGIRTSRNPTSRYLTYHINNTFMTWVWQRLAFSTGVCMLLHCQQRPQHQLFITCDNQSTCG